MVIKELIDYTIYNVSSRSPRPPEMHAVAAGASAAGTAISQAGDPGGAAATEPRRSLFSTSGHCMALGAVQWLDVHSSMWWSGVPNGMLPWSMMSHLVPPGM